HTRVRSTMRSWPTITRFTWKRASSSTAAVAAKSGWSVESSGMESFLVGAVVGWLGRLGVGAKAMVHSLAEHQPDRTCERAERSPQGGPGGSSNPAERSGAG